MRTCGFLFSFSLLILTAAITLACGSTPAPRSAQSLVVSPAAAEAQDYPGGQVPFTAIGYYNTQPSPVRDVHAQWGACYQGGITNEVTISANGLAQCAAGSSGTYTVWAFVMSGGEVCPLWVDACGGGGCHVTGTAQLTCP